MLLPPRSALENRSTWDHSRRHQHGLHAFLLVRTFLLALTVRYRQPGLSALHFRGCFIRQVSCYTLLSGFQLPWPPPCCLYETTPFMVSHEPGIRRLNLTFGSSHITSSAYQKWSTKDHAIFSECPVKRHSDSAHLKFENRLRLLQPQDL